MIRKVLGTIVIIIIILIGIGYCSGKRNSEKTENKIDLTTVSSSLTEINSSLSTYGKNILAVWEDVNNKGAITKKEMATLSGAEYNKFVTMTKEFPEETYTNGLQAAKVESDYYKNSGMLSNVKEQLNKIKTQLDEVADKTTSEYKTVLSKYTNMDQLVDLLSNPQGDFASYKQQIQEKM